MQLYNPGGKALRACAFTAINVNGKCAGDFYLEAAGTLPAVSAGLEAGAFAAEGADGAADGTEGTALEAFAAGFSAAGAGALPGTEGTAEP